MTERDEALGLLRRGMLDVAVIEAHAIPALALGVLHDGVAVRCLHRASQPERHVLAVTRPAIAGTTLVQAMITALQAEAVPSGGTSHYRRTRYPDERSKPAPPPTSDGS